MNQYARFPLLQISLAALIVAGCASSGSATATNDGGGTARDTGGNDAGGDDAAATTNGTDGGDGQDAGDDDSGPALNLEPIDDMTTPSASILNSHGRVGAWYTYNDGTTGATQTPGIPFTKTALNPPRGNAAYAARTQGSGFVTWGAGEGFNFNDPGNGDGGSAKATYDASAYSGIAVWAKAGSGSTTSLRINVPTKDTDPAGGVCTPQSMCNDHFGVNVPLATDWRQFVIPFTELKQQGWGMQVPNFDPAHLYACQFQVPASSTFDVWIADIYFIKN